MEKFRPDTQWICLDNKEGNVYFEARTLFEAASEDRPLLKITADSRYIVYLNGIKLGFGPVRYYRGAISFDEYDLGPYLNRGSNEIRVLVHHFGVETFQYQLGRPGLLAEIESGTQVISKTGKDWQIREATEFSISTPRASCQLDWVIHFDATVKGEAFGEPKIIGAVGIKPWGTPVKRDIPFLTEEKLYPQVILSESLVESPYLIKTINLQPYFRPHDYSANPAFLQGLLLTTIYAEEITEVVFPKTLERTGILFLNGQAIAFGQKVSLKQGNNLLIIDITGHYHDLFITVCIEKVTKKPLVLKNPLEDGTDNASPFLALREGEPVKTFVSQSSNDIKEALKSSQYEQVKLEHIASENVWLLSCLNQPRPGKVPIVKANNLCLGAGNPTIIKPAACDSEIILDFGKTVIGFIGFTIDAPEGVCLDFNLFEAYENGKPVYTEGLRNALRYKTKKGLQKFISPKRQGFRYLKLTIHNLEKPLTIYELYCNLSTYPVSLQGEFITSDFNLNAIYDMSRYTTRLCMEDTYVDCPTYEQTYWVGDARNEALIARTVFGDTRLTERCLRLVSPSLKRSVLPESQVPSGWENVIPAWSFLWIQAVLDHYLYSGDKKLLEDVYPAIKQTCDNALSLLDENGLFAINAWNFLDWSAMDLPDKGVVSHQNMLLKKSLDSAAFLATELGLILEANRFRESAARLKQAINEHLWDAKKEAFVDALRDGKLSEVISEQTNTMALLCEVVAKEREAILKENLLKLPPEWVKAGSPFFLFFTLELWEKLGLKAKMLQLMKEIWGLMLSLGATTCFETLPGRYPDKLTRSYCHAWSAAPAYFLPRLIFGVKGMDTGWQKVSIEPELFDLKWGRGRIPTPHGLISVEFKKKAEELSVECDLPHDIEAVFVTPKGYKYINQTGISDTGSQNLLGGEKYHLEFVADR